MIAIFQFLCYFISETVFNYKCNKDFQMKKYLKKQISALFIAGTAAIILSGCSHSQVFTEPLPANTPAPKDMQAVAYGRAQNSGYYLFNVIPLHTGHPYHPNRKDYRAWNDDITPEVNAGMLLYSMKRLYGAEELASVEHQESSWGYFSLWIIWRKTISTTATGLKKLKPAKNKKSTSGK